MKDFFVVYEDQSQKLSWEGGVPQTLHVTAQVSLQKSLHVSCECPVGCTNTPRLFPKIGITTFSAGTA